MVKSADLSATCITLGASRITEDPCESHPPWCESHRSNPETETELETNLQGRKASWRRLYEGISCRKRGIRLLREQRDFSRVEGWRLTWRQKAKSEISREFFTDLLSFRGFVDEQFIFYLLYLLFNHA